MENVRLFRNILKRADKNAIIKVQQSVTKQRLHICDAAKSKAKKGTATAMTIEECYKEMGADYAEVLKRLYSEAMIRKFVLLFLKDDSFQNLEEGLAKQDVKEAFRAAHTLKGVCQNLGFSNLYTPHLCADRDPARRHAGRHTGAVCTGGTAV